MIEKFLTKTPYFSSKRSPKLLAVILYQLKSIESIWRGFVKMVNKKISEFPLFGQFSWKNNWPLFRAPAFNSFYLVFLQTFFSQSSKICSNFNFSARKSHEKGKIFQFSIFSLFRSRFFLLPSALQFRARWVKIFRIKVKIQKNEFGGDFMLDTAFLAFFLW